MKKVAFLFGAGISLPAKLPGTEKLSTIILSGQNVIRNSDSTYSFSDVGNGSRHLISRISRFLEILNSEITHYYSYLADGSVNYEDLFYVASQVHDSLSGDYDNPVVGTFIEKILPRVNKIQIGQEDPWRLSKLADEATNYIKDLVCSALWNGDADTEYLSSISKLIMQSEIEETKIFSLNHDLIVEQHLVSQEIAFCDGFSEPVYEVKWWDSSLFDSFDGKVKLYKLHGSINWYLMEKSPSTYDVGKVAIVLDHDHWHAKNPQGEDIQSIEHHPKILAGSFNKMLQYTTGIYADLHAMFHNSIKESTRLIVCGYSFGDKGINIKIVEWLDISPKNKLIVIHKNPESLRENARGVIEKNWEGWKRSGQLRLVPEWIQETSFQDIKDAIVPG